MSDDYTPTTEDVQSDYNDFWQGLVRGVESDAAFDRWLASVKADAWDEGTFAQAAFYTGPNPYREQT